MAEKRWPVIVEENLESVVSVLREMIRIRDEDIGNHDVVIKKLNDAAAAITAITVPVKASGAELDTGTDDAKFATAKAINDSHNVPSVAPGTSGNVMTSDGTDWISSSAYTAMPVGTVLQCVTGTYAANADLTTDLPFDDTIPQNTEGNEILTVSITPKSTTNRLRVHVSTSYGENSVDGYASFAVFKDTTADALFAHGIEVLGGGTQMGFALSFHFEYVPGSVSSTTLKLRAGSNTGTMRLNGTIGGRIFGGVAATVMTVTEIKT